MAGLHLDPAFLRLLMETFRSELQEQLQVMTDGLLALEGGVEPQRQADVVNAVFRAAHNIKGAARGVEAQPVADVAHQLESLFEGLRAGKLSISPELVDLSLAACDALREIAQALVDGREPERYEALQLRLAEAAAARPLTEEASAPSSRAAPQQSPPPSEAAVQVAPAAQLQPVATGAKTAAPERPSGAEPIKVTAQKLQRVSGLTEDLQLAKIAIGEHYEAMHALSQRMGKLEARLRNVRSSLRAGPRQQRPELSPDARMALDECLPELAELRRNAAGLATAMRGTLTRTTHVAAAIQGDIRMMQLVPVSQVLRPLARMARDLGRELGKPVELTISGDHIEVDRAVLDALRDPLNHLLRNAVDHGIEEPLDRRAAGKPEVGALSIEVGSSGGLIHLTVSDDGRGMHADRVAESALRKQIVKPDELETMSEQEKLMLIFRPGFSSKEIITDLSGRGVGLDVVLSNLRRLKGSVKLYTAEGFGSEFLLELPLTLSMERGLHVRAGGENLLIPTVAVDRIAELGHGTVLEVAASNAVVMDGKTVALRELGALLDLPTRVRRHAEVLPVVLVSRGWTRVALLVDEVVGEREIVIKRLPPPLQSVPNIGGATLTGNGEIMMVLNVDDLIENAQRQQGRALGDSLQPREPTTVDRRLHVLVVDDSVTTRTLEKNMLESHGFRVTVAVDGLAGWELLQKEPFDLVISDVEMPRLSGFELTEKIRQSGRFPQLPIIIVTSLAKDSDRRRGVEAGADAYLVKSDFESRALLDIVRQLI